MDKALPQESRDRKVLVNCRIAERQFAQAHRQAAAQGMSLHRYVGVLLGIGLNLDARRLGRAARGELARRRRPSL